MFNNSKVVSILNDFTSPMALFLGYSFRCRYSLCVYQHLRQLWCWEHSTNALPSVPKVVSSGQVCVKLKSLASGLGNPLANRSNNDHSLGIRSFLSPTPRWHSSKEPSCQGRRLKKDTVDPGSGRYTEEGVATLSVLPGESTVRGDWRANVHKIAKNPTTTEAAAVTQY